MRVSNLFFFIQALSASKPSGMLKCGIPGLCKGNLLDIKAAASLPECLVAGRSNSIATWVSFKPSTGACRGVQRGGFGGAKASTVSTQMESTLSAPPLSAISDGAF